MTTENNPNLDPNRRDDDERETFWGINRKDRRWFQVMTLVGGTTGSVVLTVLQLKYRTPEDTPDILALNILLGIGASFAAAGFTSWDILQIKEVIMAIADWIRERTARNREKFRAEVMQEGFELGRAEGRTEGRAEGRTEGRAEGRTEGRAEGRTEGRAEGYHLGYDDGRQGNPPQPPPNGAFNSNTPT